MATASLGHLTVESQPPSGSFVIGLLRAPHRSDTLDQLPDFSTLESAGMTVKLRVLNEPKRGSESAAFVTRGMLEECDVVVSLQAGVPLPVLQAVSLGIPVITSALRVPEALENNPFAIRVNRGDKNGLLSALMQIAARSPEKSSSGAPGARLANFYSQSYVWRGAPPSADEQSSRVSTTSARELAKKALFGSIPTTRLACRGNRQCAQIALTFDDGPDPAHTPRILDILKLYQVKATFFVVAGEAEQYPDILARMMSDGHEIGSHSYSHPYFHRLSWRGAMNEVRIAGAMLTSLSGVPCKLFRPPHGKLSLRSLIPAWAAGQKVILWNVDLKDYCAAEGQVESQLGRHPLSGGDIVLYHGTSEPSLKALPRVIESAFSKGLAPTTISNLLGF